MAIDLQPGKALGGGRYTIVSKIGDGGFSITYRAIQSGSNRTVCIKEYFPSVRCTRDDFSNRVIPQDSDAVAFEKYRQAFRNEAETLSTLRHANIVEVIEIFDENNTSYMVMPFIEGLTLQQIVHQQGPLDYPQAVNYMAQVADAVAYIHERHILHRDIKPENIIITAEYRAILIDFGSAREFVNDKTQNHTSILTHGFAPTEQYSVNSRKGSYTDIYALGATFYYVLTGKVPLDAVSRMTEVMAEPKALNPAIPEEANRTILKAMQLNAADRHQTMQEFMDDLRNVKPSKPLVGSAKPTGKFPYWIIAVVAVAIVMAVGAGVAIHRYKQHKAQVLAEEQAALEQKMREEEEARQQAMADSIARVNFQTTDLKMLGAHGPIRSIVYDDGYDPVLSLDKIYFNENGLITKMIYSRKSADESVVIKRNSDNSLKEWSLFWDEEYINDWREKHKYVFNADGFVKKITNAYWESGSEEILSWDENGKLMKSKDEGDGEAWVWEYTTTYKYLKTDAFGNWTELEYTSTGYDYEWDSSDKGEKHITKNKITRTIEYYE